VSELLSVATPGPDPDADMPSETSTPSEKPLLCDTATQVVPERKNARIQTTQRTKTCGKYLSFMYMHVYT
jgi:hypothetical protein